MTVAMEKLKFTAVNVDDSSNVTRHAAFGKPKLVSRLSYKRKKLCCKKLPQCQKHEIAFGFTPVVKSTTGVKISHFIYC